MPSEADYAIQRSAVITQTECHTSPVGLQTITHVQLDCTPWTKKSETRPDHLCRGPQDGLQAKLEYCQQGHGLAT